MGNEDSPNADLLKRYWRALNERDRETFEEFLAADVRRHNESDVLITGAEQYAETEFAFLESFPGELTIEHLVAEDDFVVVHYRAHGTHEAAVSGLDPTGERIEYEGLELFRVEDGEIVESWHFADLEEIFEVLRFTRELDDLKIRRQYRDVLGRVLRHNLRTELEVVRAAVESLPADDPEVAETVELVEEAVDELLAVATKTRSLARETVERNLEPRPVDLGTFVERLAEHAADTHPAATIDTSVPEDAVTVTTDPPLLESVVTEAVENAVEHAAHDDPTVRLEVTALAGDEGDSSRSNEAAAMLAVVDDGPGVPDHELDPFERGAETPLIHASGVGLWTIAWGVERLGGEVDFEPAEPTGTAVRIRLPDLE